MGGTGFPDISASTPQPSAPSQGPAPDETQIPAPPQVDPEEQSINQTRQLLQAKIQKYSPQPGQGGPIRRLLGNFIHGMGQGMMKDAGLPTDEEEVQNATRTLNQLDQTQGTIDYHRALIQQMQQKNQVTFTPETSKALIGDESLAGQSVPPAVAAALQKSFATRGANMPPEVANVLGVPDLANQPVTPATIKALADRQGKMAVTPDMIQRYQLPPESAGKFVKMQDILSAERLLQAGSRTLTRQQWLPDGAGGFQLATTTSQLTRGATTVPSGAPANLPANVPAPLRNRINGATSPSAGGGKPSATPGRILTQQPVYAFNPATGETQLSTSQEAAQHGFLIPRKVTAPRIQEDTQLNNRLTDVATKITRYDDLLNKGNDISQSDRDMISGVLSSDKLKIGLGLEGMGFEIPVDRLNQWLDANNIKNMSDQAKQVLLGYINARESIQGYQRVLSGTSRSSDTGLNLNLAALPSPVNPRGYVHSGIGQFAQNVEVAGRGVPRMPGIPNAKDVFAQHGTDTSGGGGTSGPPAGATHIGVSSLDGKKYYLNAQGQKLGRAPD